MNVSGPVKQAIEKAIQMERDGHAFYTKAAAQTSSDMGRTIFESIARDELVHLDTFQKIFRDKVGKEEWNALVRSSNKYADLPVFPKDLKQVEGAEPDTNELGALKFAMDAEKEAIDYYTRISQDAGDDEVRRIFDTVIEQEKSHYLILNEEYNHLTSTGYWYGLDVLGT